MVKRHHKEQNKLQNGEASSQKNRTNYRMVKRHQKEQNKLQNGERSSQRTEQITEW